MLVGIGYHSPLDVVSLFPTNIKYSMCLEDNVDVLISGKVELEYKARIQMVFASTRVLLKANLSIIDQGAWGKIITLTNEQIEELLKKKSMDVIPDWVKNFRIK